MGMAKKQMKGKRAFALPILLHKLKAQISYPRSGVKDDLHPLAYDTDTRGVSPILLCNSPWGGNGAPGSPKGDEWPGVNG